jgi:hypothetical protein
MNLSTLPYHTLKQKVTHALEKIHHPLLSHQRTPTRGRKLALTIIDILTLGIFRHTHGIETKKDIFNLFQPSCSYKTLVVSLNRFSLLMLFLIIRLVNENRKNAHLVKYTDATDLPVCLVKNATRHKTMRGLATWGKTGKGWFYGLKLHLTCDSEGRILSFSFTPGNTNDRAQFMVLNKALSGIFVADAGYLSEKLAREFYQEHIRILFTKPRANMKKMATDAENALYDSRAFIESIFRNLKLFDGLVSSLPRSVDGYFAHYFFALAARILA